LNADMMLASLAMIGLIGFAFERLVFGSIERATVMRWGMVRMEITDRRSFHATTPRRETAVQAECDNEKSAFNRAAGEET
jgi:hypothetical protein